MFVIVQSPQGLQNVQTNNSPLLNLNWKRLTTPHQAVFTQTWTQEQFEKKKNTTNNSNSRGRVSLTGNWRLETQTQKSQNGRSHSIN